MGIEQEGAGAGGAGEERGPQAVGDEAGGGEEVSPEVATLQGQLQEERTKAVRYLANWQRAEADLANFRRRAEQERAELSRYANGALIGRLLPVLDDFDRAIDAIPEEQRSVGWVEGIRLIDRKLRTILEQEGVTPIEALGKEFDPYVHEAVMRVDGEGDTDVVVEELQRGYKLHDRVLRPAMVKVGRQNRRSDSE